MFARYLRRRGGWWQGCRQSTQQGRLGVGRRGGAIHLRACTTNNHPQLTQCAQLKAGTAWVPRFGGRSWTSYDEPDGVC